MDNRTIEEVRENETKLIKELQQKDHIIEELEKWLKEKDNKGYEKIYLEDALNKLQELKGESNE